MDWAAEGFLDGLEGRARDERVELLELLAAEGVGEVDLHTAHEQGLLVYLLAEYAIAGPPRYTARELAEEAGIDVAFLMQMRRAHGLPIPDADARVFHESDALAAHHTRSFLDAGLTKEQLLATARVFGRGLAPAAEVMRGVAFEQALAPGASEADLARRFAAVAGQLTPMMGPVIEQMLRLHLRHGLMAEILNAGDLTGTRDVTIAFADLSGFTRLGESVGADRLDQVARRFDDLVSEFVHHPVRLVKTLGDGALLVAQQPGLLTDTALELVAAAEGLGDEFPQLRVGLACGQAFSRAGDWYGRPVNLASRVTGVARPGSVLATEEVYDRVGDRLRWSFAGQRALRGVRAPVKLYRARRPQPSDAAA